MFPTTCRAASPARQAIIATTSRQRHLAFPIVVVAQGCDLHTRAQAGRPQNAALLPIEHSQFQMSKSYIVNHASKPLPKRAKPEQANSPAFESQPGSTRGTAEFGLDLENEKASISPCIEALLRFLLT